ncbi:unnamed protein product [Symbiodinium sp. CCMP2456]|nr:unnamed protein product [Symbiodinium sp. CCMP2456]
MDGGRIAYRFTFIDVAEELQVVGEARRGRARSHSPVASQSESLVVDAWAQRHVRTLRQGQDTTVCDPPAPSRGSVGHPTLCSRPCVYFAKQGQCPTGEACGYCHQHHSSARKPDKQQRDLMKMMPRAELLSLLAELLRERAEQDGLEDAGFAVAVVAVHAGLPGASTSFSKQECRRLRLLRQVVGAMNFSAMLSLTSRYCEGHSQAVILRELQALQNNAQ